MADSTIGSPEWLAQQRQQAKQSNLATAPVGYNPPSGDTISSSLFTSTPSLTPTTPQVSPPSGVPQISTSPLVETPKEQEASDLIKRIQTLQDTLAGKPAFKQQEEKQFDITGKTQLVQDLTAQYNDLLAQSKNIPERLQLEATGRGITAGGLEPIQTGELRKLSIASNTIAAQLQAAQGNVAFAQSLVEKAVSDEFAPIEAELDAKTKNLKLIIDSPEYSLQDKNRAQAQADAIENQKNAVADEKQNKKDVLSEVNNAIKNGLTDPNIIAMMKGQGTGVSAALIAAEAGFGQPKLKTGAIAQFEELYGRKPTPQEYFDFIRKEKEAAKTPSLKGKTIFTQTQLNKGAAMYGKSLEEFDKLDFEAKNYFINRETDLGKAKKSIEDEVKKKSTSFEEIKNHINDLQIPQEVKDFLIQFAQSKSPKEKEKPFWHFW